MIEVSRKYSSNAPGLGGDGTAVLPLDVVLVPDVSVSELSDDMLSDSVKYW